MPVLASGEGLILPVHLGESRLLVPTKPAVDQALRRGNGEARPRRQSKRHLAGGVAGPVMGGLVFDRIGAYTPAILVMAIAIVVAVPLLLAVRRPTLPAPEASPAKVPGQGTS